MPRRPFIITLLTIGYVVSPLFILFQGSLVHQLPVLGPQGLLSRLFFTDIIILCFYPISAAAIFSVRKWGWYLFIGSAVVLISYNVYVFSLSPRYNLFLLILYNIAIAVVAGIFFRKHVIAPYFNPRLRWWETEPRFSITIYLDIHRDTTSIRGELLDISMSGCFVSAADHLRTGQVCQMTLHCMQRQVDIAGRLLRSVSLEANLMGYGIMFVKMSAVQEDELRGIIGILERGGLRNMKRDVEQERTGAEAAARVPKKTAPRYLVSHSAFLIQDDVRYPCTIIDISKHGCLVATESDLTVNARYGMRIRCMKNELTVQARIERKTSLHGMTGFGVAFVDLSGPRTHELRKIIHTLKRIGSQNRTKTASPVPERVIDEGVRNTPYRMVLFLSRFLRSARR